MYWNRENLHNNKECEVKNGLTLGLVSPSTSAAYRPLSMNACRSLARSTHQPSKIVYANAKQSPMNEERCVVNPPLSPSLLVSSSGTSWVHDSRDSWRRHLEEREREGGSLCMPPSYRSSRRATSLHRHVCHMYGNGDVVLERWQFRPRCRLLSYVGCSSIFYLVNKMINRDDLGVDVDRLEFCGLDT